MTGTPTLGAETTNAQLREQPGVLSETETETKPSHDSTRTGTLAETMQISRKDNPYPATHKTALLDTIRKFRAAQSDLDHSYQGRPYDSAYEKDDDRINGELDAELRAAMPFGSPAEAAEAVLLERDLLIQFHGDRPTGIHATRLTLLEAIHSYLAGSEQTA